MYGYVLTHCLSHFCMLGMNNMMGMGGRGGFNGAGHFNPAFIQGGGQGGNYGPDGPRKRFKMEDSG